MGLRLAVSMSTLLLCGALAAAQEAGNSVYGAPRRTSSGVALGNLYSTEVKDSTPSHFIEANVLLNVRADEYVAVLGLAQEGKTVPEAQERMDGQIAALRRSLATLGVKDSDVTTDYISQSRAYDFDLSGNTAREEQTGFEVKKNLAVRYRDKSLLEPILSAAAKAGVFDLIKVDYVVTDLSAVKERLFLEASKVLSRKQESYLRLLEGVKLRPDSVFQEKYNVFFPSEMYQSYEAYSSGRVAAASDVRVVEKRKTSTFYFEPLHPGEFDSVINAAGAEPVVECTLYLKVKYLRVPPSQP